MWVGSPTTRLRAAPLTLLAPLRAVPPSCWITGRKGRVLYVEAVSGLGVSTLSLKCCDYGVGWLAGHVRLCGAVSGGVHWIRYYRVRVLPVVSARLRGRRRIPADYKS